MATQRRHRVSPEDYLAAERSARTKSEYLDGEVVAMVGASERHVLIVSNLVISLHGQLRGRPCRIYASDLRVRVAGTGLYTYPDLSVVCGAAPQLEDAHGDTLLNPGLIAEVLSPSTEAYDRGSKFAHYRQVPSLTDYLLIAQDQPHIEHYQRLPDGGWLLSEASSLNDALSLPSLRCALPLREVYAQVAFDASE